MLKEIKKRAQIYGVAAVILAIMLGVLCYSLTSYPSGFKPPRPSSSVFLSTFSSNEELKSFLTKNSRTQGPFLFLGPLNMNAGPVRSMMESSQIEPVTAPGLSSESEYSTTNIQVAGVDEADILKTDGEYIYLVSGSSVLILKAYPAEEAEIVSRITFNDTSLGGIFISQGGERLAVLGCKYKFPESYYQTFIIDVKTFLDVYDISNKSRPTLATEFAITGSYFSSRMIGDYVYFVVSQPSYIVYDTVILPKVYSNNVSKEISATEILHSETSDNYFLYATVVALNVQNVTEQPTRKTLLLGGTSNMYVSPGNIYITFPEPALDGNTTIYRIRIENSTIDPEAKGEVPGHELNQFSMDEYNNYFRIATTTRVNGTTQNNLYVLNMNLSIVGSLENIAPSETINSARFIENRCYLATSIVRRDPFFVIDVENTTAPKILGYLKIPGFTSYLHPYDETHVIGVGRNENNSVKISLFDVSNVSDPVEIDMYSVEGVWSDTLALTDHKAFLFDRSKDLLAIPMSIYYGGEYLRWNGLCVFNITLSDGIVLRGSITHQENSSINWDTVYDVKRALYIENVLYSLSDKKIKMNSLEDLTEIREIQLS